MTKVKNRVLAGMGANFVTQLIAIGIQLASLPLFLSHWSLDEYGLWLMLSAVPSYFAIADVGMVTAAGNEMTMAIGRGDTVTANRTFQSALVFMLVACGAVAITSISAVLLLPIPELKNFDQRTALSALILGVLLSLFGGLCEAIFKATGRYALGTTLANALRVGEWCGWMTGLTLFGTLSAVAIGGLSIRIIGLIILIVLSAKGNHGLRWQTGDASWAKVRAMIKPAVAFMAFPTSNALSLQGMTLLTGYELGPSAVAILNAYRTIARVSVQATSTFSHALWPEFSFLYGKGGVRAVNLLYRRAAYLGYSLALVLGVILYFLGPLLLRLWTHGAITFRSTLMLLMVGYAAAATSWHVPRVFLMSINGHGVLARWSLIVSAGSLLIATGLAPAWKLEGIVASMLLSEIGIAMACAILVQRQFVTVNSHTVQTSP